MSWPFIHLHPSGPSGVRISRPGKHPARWRPGHAIRMHPAGSCSPVGHGAGIRISFAMASRRSAPGSCPHLPPAHKKRARLVCPDSEGSKEEARVTPRSPTCPLKTSAGGPRSPGSCPAMAAAALIGAGSVYPAAAMVSPWLFARLPSSSYTAINKAPRNGSSPPWL